jgi:nitrate reductase gamma subunit
MNLLDFARGPAIDTALIVFVFGVVWRLSWLLFLPASSDISKARSGTSSRVSGAAQAFIRHMWPARAYAARTMFGVVNSYVFHLGLAIVVLGFAEHVLFIRDLTGLSWPTLPTGVITMVSVVTLAALVVALGRRLFNPVLKIISTAGDYWAWFVTAFPVATGIATVSHFWLRYEDLLAIHILSVCLLLISFPFGKLMHAFLVFITRSQTGITYSRRSAEI